MLHDPYHMPRVKPRSRYSLRRCPWSHSSTAETGSGQFRDLYKSKRYKSKAVQQPVAVNSGRIQHTAIGYNSYPQGEGDGPPGPDTPYGE